MRLIKSTTNVIVIITNIIITNMMSMSSMGIRILMLVRVRGRERPRHMSIRTLMGGG
jgi:hypothetical protein